MNRKLSWLFTAILLALTHRAEAQQPKIPRIGYIHTTGNQSDPGPYRESFLNGLRDLGYVDGQNIIIETRTAEGRLDRLPTLLHELVQDNVDIIVALNNLTIRAAIQATKKIPIIIVSSIDPVVAGYIQSFARPGGNITGIANLNRELNAKRIDLLKEALPRMSRVSVLWDADGPGAKIAFKQYQAVARAFRTDVQSVEIRGPNPDFTAAFNIIKRRHANAVIIVQNPLTAVHQKRIAELAKTNLLPSMAEDKRQVDSGSLMSYGANISDVYRRVATYIDKILKGAKPADLPVEQPRTFELVINLETAKQIGLTIPPNVLARADRVIR